MNARLINTDPEVLQSHAETCSAVAFLLLETSGKYFDLQMGAVKSSLDSFRSQCDLLEPAAGEKDLLAGYNDLFAKSLEAGSQLLCQSLTVSAGSQREFGALMGQGWSQVQESTQKAIEAQLVLAKKLSQALVAGQR